MPVRLTPSLDPVVLELHLRHLELAHEDGDEEVDGKGGQQHCQTNEGRILHLYVQEKDGEADLEQRRPEKRVQIVMH